MSAYSASPPVTVSTTAPSTSNACQPWSAKKLIAHIGLSARSTIGLSMML